VWALTQWRSRCGAVGDTRIFASERNMILGYDS
jgi:hypothetical protein